MSIIKSLENFYKELLSPSLKQKFEWNITELPELERKKIERIEIVRGPISVLYGSNASAGVVNIITKTIETARIIMAIVPNSGIIVVPVRVIDFA